MPTKNQHGISIIHINKKRPELEAQALISFDNRIPRLTRDLDLAITGFWIDQLKPTKVQSFFHFCRSVDQHLADIRITLIAHGLVDGGFLEDQICGLNSRWRHFDSSRQWPQATSLLPLCDISSISLLS